jgi:antitoxin VapB
MHQIAEVFFIDSDQAVRLPIEFRFDAPEVFIRHDPFTGDVILSRKPTDWQGLIDAVTQNKDLELELERRQDHSRRDPIESLNA